MTDLINPSEMIMEIREVVSVGRVFDPNVPDMGDLVDEGILTKEYKYNTFTREIDIVWTNISKNVIVGNDYETILPGESVTWEK
tara:strand:+ start:444 stop:695 length:252 start_codon:yes stop_codon:yes gene_type:complete